MKRLIVFILFFVFFLGFIVLNLENSCNISFGFTILEDVPVFLTALCSFVLGLLFTLPMILLGKSKKPPQPKVQKLPKRSKKSGKAGELEPFNGAEGGLGDEIKKENSPYGID